MPNLPWETSLCSCHSHPLSCQQLPKDSLMREPDSAFPQPFSLWLPLGPNLVLSTSETSSGDMHLPRARTCYPWPLWGSGTQNCTFPTPGAGSRGLIQLHGHHGCSLGSWGSLQHLPTQCPWGLVGHGAPHSFISPTSLDEIRQNSYMDRWGILWNWPGLAALRSKCHRFFR